MEQTWTELPRKLTPTLKRKITKDWHAYFPGLTLRKPMCFDRRVGPLLVHIGLQPIFEGEHYRPGFSVHNLSRPMDFLTANLSDDLRTIRTDASESLKVRWHEKNYREAAERMNQQAHLPLEGPISLDMVVEAYKNYVNKNPNPKLIDQLEDPALIAAWAGEPEKAKEALEWGYQQLRTWPEKLQNDLGGPEAWRERMQERISNPEELRKITREEVEKHKLTKVNYQDFTDTAYKELG